MLLPSLLDKLTQTWQTQLLDFTTIQHWRNKSGKFMFVIRNMNLLNYLTSQPSNTGGTNLDNSCLSSLTWTYSTTWLHNLPIPWSELRTSSAALFICCLHFFFNNFMMVWVGKSRFECSIDERWSQNKRPCGRIQAKFILSELEECECSTKLKELDLVVATKFCP